MNIGVMGCVRDLPVEFPINKAENAGNMIHGNAPFVILDNAVLATDFASYNSRGYKNFVEFVNNECSHLILTLANTLKLGQESLPNLERMSSLLAKIEKPVVTFGLGGQSQVDSIDDQILAPEAIKLVQEISEKTELLGVRGEITAEIVRKKAGVRNVYVTGCPSVFSRPEGIKALRDNLDAVDGRPAFNGTKFHEHHERRLLWSAIDRDQFLVEPVNKFNHGFHTAVNGSNSDADIPYFLNGYVDGSSERKEYLVEFFRKNYRLFRSPSDWFAFNAESVSFTYGSRFHVNMASILSGVPAFWLTHDSRTRELVDYMNLPNIDIEKFRPEDDLDIDWHSLYGDFFKGLPEIRERFEVYLHRNGLPTKGVNPELFGIK